MDFPMINARYCRRWFSTPAPSASTPFPLSLHRRYFRVTHAHPASRQARLANFTTSIRYVSCACVRAYVRAYARTYTSRTFVRACVCTYVHVAHVRACVRACARARAVHVSVGHAFHGGSHISSSPPSKNSRLMAEEGRRTRRSNVRTDTRTVCMSTRHRRASWRLPFDEGYRSACAAARATISRPPAGVAWCTMSRRHAGAS